jgi:hypothetical protein
MSRALVALASALLVAATLTAYAWRVLYDSGQFAARATATLADPRTRTVIGDRVTDELILPRRSELLAARPLVSSAVAGVVGTDAFASLFRRSVRDVHAAVFRGEQDTLTLALADVAIVVAAALRALEPELAASLESDARVVVVQRDLGHLTGDILRLGQRLRALALVLAGLTLAAMIAALALSRERRRTAAQIGAGIAAAGIAIVAVDTVAEALVLANADEPDVWAAAWDAFLGDLRTAGWVIAGVGAVIAAAAASVLRPVAIEERARLAWRHVSAEPDSAALRVLRAVTLVAAGVFTVAAPEAVLVIVTTLIGVYLVFKGLELLLRVIYRPGEERTRPRLRRLAVPLVATLAIATALAAFVTGGGVDEPAQAVTGCNGRAALCDRPLTEIALAATHNAMSVPEPGWYAALQERPIAGQLEDGIRGLLLDTHYADRLPNGRTRTYFTDAEDIARTAQQDGVSPESVAAAARLRARAGFRGEGERGMYLCHTFCELGATPLAGVLDDVHEFLVTHPADVLVIVNQDYVTPEDFVGAIRAAGLERYVFTPPRGGGGWPTLREMIDRDERLMVLAENRAGAAPWYQLAYERLVQETPFTFKEVARLTGDLEPTCAPNRGTGEAPLLLINHWINTDPAPRPANAEIVNAFEPLLSRAETCRRIRGRQPNLLAVDFYARGDVFAVVDALNGTR